MSLTFTTTAQSAHTLALVTEIEMKKKSAELALLWESSDFYFQKSPCFRWSGETPVGTVRLSFSEEFPAIRLQSKLTCLALLPDQGGWQQLEDVPEEQRIELVSKFRRGCFLSGGNLACMPDEIEEWTMWLERRRPFWGLYTNITAFIRRRITSCWYLQR